MLFLVDVILNIVVFGLFRGDKTYIKRRKTNLLNIFLTLICIPSIFPSFGSIYIIYKIGKLKVFRICILINIFCEKNATMKFTVLSFAKLFPKLIRLLFIVFVFYGFFAIMMVKLYANELFYCINFPDNVTI